MSSHKGGQFEREIAVQLSEWWTSGLGKKVRQDVFWRTAGSGARATVRTKSTQRTRGQYGDLCATDPIGRPFIDVFTTELKRGYNQHTIANLLDCPATSKIQQYEEWFIKLVHSHRAAGSLSWMLIHRRTRREPIVFLPSSMWRNLYCDSDAYLPVSFITAVCDLREPKKRRLANISGMLLEQFLQCVNPERIVELSKS